MTSQTKLFRIKHITKSGNNIVLKPGYTVNRVSLHHV